MGVLVPASFSIVVAVESGQSGIGLNNALPWHSRDDMRYFKHLTTAAPPHRQNAVIMGRRTWESLPNPPLPHRVNVVVSTQSNLVLPDGVMRAQSLEHALGLATLSSAYRTFVMGGEQLYQVALLHHRLQAIYLTRLLATMACDRFFPPIPDRLKRVQWGSPNPTLRFEVWRSAGWSS
ncbi:dihydrofolate reductase [bacterium]|nr:dihydrofolate reductase [bacterium]